MPRVRQGAEPHRPAAQPHAEPAPGADAAAAAAAATAAAAAAAAAAVPALTAKIRGGAWYAVRKRHFLTSAGKSRSGL